MASKIYTLTPAEWELLQQCTDDPNRLFSYWFARPEGGAFQFDHNFVNEGKWQVEATLASQSQIVVIGGVGTGKTLWGGMQACFKSMITDGYKFMDVAPKAWQSKLMYDEIMKWAEGTRFEKLIVKNIERPYPKIVIGFRYGKRTFRSSLEFMSMADDAQGVFSWRGDEIFVEEAGLQDTLEETITMLWTRLNGSTPSGRAFFGRLLLVSNPWDNPHLWRMADMAYDDPDGCLTLVLSTRHNKNVSEQQLANMLKHIPEHERGRFLDGTRPEGHSTWINVQKIYACEDLKTSEEIVEHTNALEPGYRILRDRTLGVTEFTTPPVPGAIRVILGDPGHGKAPNRDSPVLMVWEIPDDFPAHPMRLVAFWWGDGGGEITRFVEKLLAWSGKSPEYAGVEPNYDPAFIGIDSTGPQKSLATLVNVQFLDENDEFQLVNDQEALKSLNLVQKVTGLDFSGSKKTAYLLSLRLFVENSMMKWPDFVRGIRSQLSNYDPALDRGPYARKAQDIVACMAMSAFAARWLFKVEDEKLVPEARQLPPPDSIKTGRYKRFSNQLRTRRSSRGPVQAVRKPV